MKNMDSKVKPENTELIAKLVESVCVAERTLLCMENICNDVVPDAMQDTCLKIWKNIDRFESSEYKNFDAVIKIMARNAGMDSMRGLKKQRKFVGTPLPHDLVDNNTDAALDDCDMRSQREHIEELSEQLQPLIDGLSKEMRTILFSRITGKTVAEVAGEVGMKHTTAQSRRRRLENNISVKLDIERAHLILLLAHMKETGLIDEADMATKHTPSKPR